MKVLVVDDDIASLGTLCSMLRTCGHHVDTAPSADMGMRMLKMTHYDVVFLDYNMPTHNGVWFMRNAGVPKDTSVVLVTGYAEPTAMADFRRLGIEVVIKKPFTMVAIDGCIKDILGMNSTRQQAADATEEPEVDAEDEDEE